MLGELVKEEARVFETHMQRYFSEIKASAYLISRSVNKAVANLPVSHTTKSLFRAVCSKRKDILHTFGTLSKV